VPFHPARLGTTGPLTEILSATDNLRHGITIDRVIRAVGITAEADASEIFIEAMMRVRTADGRYRLMEGRIQFTEQTLFRADVELPANLTEGIYKVRMFILRGGRVVADQERLIGVRKEGLERLIFAMSQQQPLLAAAAGHRRGAADDCRCARRARRAVASRRRMAGCSGRRGAVGRRRAR